MEIDFCSSHSQFNDVVAITLMMQPLHATVTPFYCNSNTIAQTKTQSQNECLNVSDRPSDVLPKLKLCSVPTVRSLKA